MKNIYLCFIRSTPGMAIPLRLDEAQKEPKLIDWAGEKYLVGNLFTNGDWIKIRNADIIFHQITDEDNMRRSPILVPGGGRIQ